MPLYRTKYNTPDGRPQQTECYARNDEHLEEVLALRGMGETRDDPSARFWEAEGRSLRQPVLPSTYLRQQKWADAMHSMVWVAMIATRAGISDGWGLLNDYGIVHEMSHVCVNTANFPRPINHDFLVKVEAFEQSVPGVHPKWADGDVKAVYRASPLDDLRFFPLDGLLPYQREAMRLMYGDRNVVAFDFEGFGKVVKSTADNPIVQIATAMRNAASAFDDFSHMVRDYDFPIVEKKPKPGSRADVARQIEAYGKPKDKSALLAKLKATAAKKQGKMMVGIDPAAPGQDRTTGMVTIGGREVAKIKSVSMVRVVREAAFGKTPGGTVTGRISRSQPEPQELPEPKTPSVRFRQITDLVDLDDLIMRTLTRKEAQVAETLRLRQAARLSKEEEVVPLTAPVSDAYISAAEAVAYYRGRIHDEFSFDVTGTVTATFMDQALRDAFVKGEAARDAYLREIIQAATQ